MKRIAQLLCITITTSIWASAQNQFIGIYRLQNKGCGDYIMEQANVATPNDFEEVCKAFKIAHKSENPACYFINESQNAIVYEYVTQLYTGACKYKEIVVTKGSSLESIRATQNELYTRYKGNYVTAPVEKVVFTAKAATAEKPYTKAFAHFTTTIIPQQNQGKRAYTVQLHSKNSKQAIIIKFTPEQLGNSNSKNANTITIVLPPNTTITQKLGEAVFYTMQYSEPVNYAPTKDEKSLIETVKSFTKEVIDNNKQEIIPMGAVGVRG